MQKKYTTDTLPKQQKRNHGEREMYFITGSNDAIISQDIFDRAQALRKKRKVELAPIT